LQKEWELYNVVEDPSEQVELITKETEVAARVRAQLDAWNASVDKSVEGADYPERRVLPTGRKDK
jgi:inactivated superfamily I helicase